MSYPEDVGPDPELSGRRYFAEFRKKLASFIFRRDERATKPVEESDFMLAVIEFGEYFDVHHEKYLTKRFFPERRFLPVEVGDVTIVAIQDYENYQSEFTYYVAAAYAPIRPGDPPDIDYTLVYKQYNEDAEEELFHTVPVRPEEVQRLFHESNMLQPGSECYVLHRKKTDDVLRELEPEDIIGPKDKKEVSIIKDHQAQLRKILKVIGYSGTTA